MTAVLTSLLTAEEILPAVPVTSYPAAEALERALGDPTDPGNPYGWDAAVSRDAAGAFPQDLAHLARDHGLALAYVPREEGGTLDTFDATLALTRVAARRDGSVMPATMFSVTATTCLLVHGNPEQRAAAVSALRGGDAVAFALSEPDAGSDLVANACSLDGDPGARTLSGSKWLVGMGDRAGLVYLVARTGGRGPGAFGAVLLDPRRLPADRVRVSRTTSVGLTGIGLTRFDLDAVPVPEEALVGRPGEGMAVAMQGMQVVRLLSTAANLACGDVAVRLALDFLAAHRSNGRLALDWAPARRELARAVAALVAVDAVAITGARALHARPATFGLRSAVAKRVATQATADLVDAVGDLLASRGALAEGAGAVLDKLRRDVHVVRSIDTPPAATLRLLAGQLAAAVPVAGGPETGAEAGAATCAPDAVPTLPPDVTAPFDLAAPLPGYDPARLDLGLRGGDEVTSALAALGPAIDADLATREGDPLAPAATRLLGALRADLTDLTDAVRAGRGQRGDAAEVARLDLADRFCDLHAAATCVLLWWHNREASLWGQPPGSLRWLVPALSYLVDDRGGRRTRYEELEPAAGLALDLTGAHRLLSAVPIALTPPVNRRPS